MLTQQSSAAAPDQAAATQPRSLDDLIAYFEGDWVPLRDAKVSIMTHAFMYGTATFEGIRGYWNEEQGQLYGLFLREHMERIRNSAKMLLMEDLPTVDELVAIVVETVAAQRVPRGRLHPAVVLQEHARDRRPAAPPRPRAVRDRDAVRELHRHREGRPDHDLDLAPQRRRGAAGPRQDRRRLREHGVPEVRGGAQRLRRGAGAHARRSRLRGVGGEPVRGPRRRAADAAGVRRHPRGRHPQGDRPAGERRRDPGRGPLDRPLRALRLRRGLPVRHRRPGEPGGRGRPPPGRHGRDRAGRRG